ncbi:extracellular solute-binding protein [Arthrobacter tumbae]|uniref:ABC transporter substrate-binding protein n=1 Tax=Arthrobacter tumbae TaxID=163874 RepID=UPI00195CD8E1|nr:extracellular solute-binding protein [Arthrobacter tumbae]MBM7781881.1 ABC-type glycerol-3-phosphate transport system substrate-binding protein [Arthrobacter tumbae]
MAKKHIAGVAAAALLLAGCSAGGGETGSEGGEPSGEITVLTNRTDLVDTLFQEYKAEFEEQYPDVTVDFEAITDYEGEVTTRLSTGDYGDVLGIPNSVTPDQLPQFFEPLGTVEEMKEQYRYVDKAAYDGTAYGMATFGNANGFLYNTAVWEEAGITETPTTPDEFLDALRAIQENTEAIPYYTNYADGWPLGQWQGNRGISGDPETVNEMNSIDNPWSDGKEQYVLDGLLFDIVAEGLSEDDPLTTEWEGSKGMTATGEIATMALGSWAITQFEDAAEAAGVDPETIGFMPFPYQENGTFYSQTGGDFSNAINVNSENKVAARAWVDWFANESGFAESQGAIPPQVDSELPESLSTFEELGVELIELTPAPAENATLHSDIYNEAEIDLFGQIYRQQLVDVARGAADGDKESFFEDLNTRWAQARAEVTS